MLDPEMKRKVIEFLQGHGAKRIAIFGSYARGEETRESDLDILVEFSGRKSLLDIIGMEQDLSDIIGIKVDLLTERSIEPQIMSEIRKDMAPVFG